MKSLFVRGVVAAGFLVSLLVPAAATGAAIGNGTSEGWTTPETVADPVSNSAPLQLAYGSSGSAVVAWYTPKGSALMASTRPPGGEWSQPVRLGRAHALSQNGPSVAVDAQGNAVVAWTDDDYPCPCVRVAVHAPGGQWKTSKFVDSLPVQSPDVAAFADGAIVTWTSNASQVMYAIRRPTGHWTTPHALMPGYGSQLAANSTGDIVISARTDDTDTGQVEARTRLHGERWSDVILLSKKDDSDTDWPDLAMNEAGNAIATWRTKQSVDGPTVVVASEESSGTWTPETLLSASDDETLDASRAAIDDRGRAYVTWTERFAIGGRVQARVMSPDGSWGHVSTISQRGVEAWIPAVAAAGHSAPVIAWLSGPSDDVTVQSAVRADHKWIGGGQIFGSDFYIAYGPVVATDGNGRTTAAIAAGRQGGPYPLLVSDRVE